MAALQSLFVAPDPAVVLPLVFGAAGLYVAGIVAMSVAPLAPVIALGAFGFQSPDRVVVEADGVRTEPEDGSRPRTGLPPGRRPLFSPLRAGAVDVE